jgi:hypothetical protein
MSRINQAVGRFAMSQGPTIIMILSSFISGLIFGGLFIKL